MIVFDLETQHLASEVGGWANKHLLRLAVACSYDLDYQARTWWEPQAVDLIATLDDHELIVGYNIRAFDYHVLSFYNHAIENLFQKTFDILAEVRRQTGLTLSLNHLSTINLGEVKTFANAVTAVELFRTGQLDELEAYCGRDVELTQRLFEKWEAEGYLWVDQARTRWVFFPGYHHLLEPKQKLRKRRRI